MHLEAHGTFQKIHMPRFRKFSFGHWARSNMLKMSKIMFLALFSLPVHAVLVFYATKGRKNAFLHDFAKNNFLASSPPCHPWGQSCIKCSKIAFLAFFSNTVNQISKNFCLPTERTLTCWKWVNLYFWLFLFFLKHFNCFDKKNRSSLYRLRS